jgi:hypothetical protein
MLILQFRKGFLNQLEVTKFETMRLFWSHGHKLNQEFKVKKNQIKNIVLDIFQDFQPNKTPFF